MILKKKLFKTFLFELLVMAFIPIILFTAYVHHSIFKKFNNNLNELQKSYFFTASSNFKKTLDNAVETAMFISEDNRVEITLPGKVRMPLPLQNSCKQNMI